jgi:hypothetical protein
MRMGFSATVKGNHSHMVFPDTPLHVDALTDDCNCLGTSTWWDSSPASLSPALDNMKVVTELMAGLRILSLRLNKLRCWIENQHKTWDHSTQSHIQALRVDGSKCAFGAILHQPLFLGGFLPPLILRLPLNSSMSTQIIHCSKNHKQLLTYTVCCNTRTVDSKFCSTVYWTDISGYLKWLFHKLKFKVKTNEVKKDTEQSYTKCKLIVLKFREQVDGSILQSVQV